MAVSHTPVGQDGIVYIFMTTFSPQFYLVKPVVNVKLFSIQTVE